MFLSIQAACGCSTGRVRRNNEDNFVFDGRCLDQDNDGLREVISVRRQMKYGTYAAVFDGLGGEQFGEYASFLAADKLRGTKRTLKERCMKPQNYLAKLALLLDNVVIKAQKEMCTRHMGTTLAGLWFFGRKAYVCNLGDSRVYRLRGEALEQLSVDHVEKRSLRSDRKAPLTQHLGAGSEEIQVEPHIQVSRVKRGDKYLLCSDGLTDMLTDDEIKKVLEDSMDAYSCVQSLLKHALEHGGRDNVTVIVFGLGRKFKQEKRKTGKNRGAEA